MTATGLALYLLLGLVFLGGLLVAVRLAAALYSYFRFRGQRLITCPENRQTAAVEVDARRAAVTSLLGPPELRLQDCSRWPVRAGCGQECLLQIETQPEACLVRNIITRWYAGKSCVYCGKAIGEVDWLNHKPALMNESRTTVQWNALPAERLPEVLRTHLPVCWDCHIAESFRKEHPELVVDRPRDAAGG